MTSFDSTKEQLKKILEQVNAGELQLPDFQRSWVWDDARIQSLLASVATAFPIGALMFYEQGNPEVRFKTRPIEGVSNGHLGAPSWLILDGQQRITALYQALMSNEPVETRDVRNRRLRRWYYVSIAQVLDSDVDLEDAVFSVPEDRTVKTFRGEVVRDLSTREKEWASEAFPVNLVFDNPRWMQWYSGYSQFGSEDTNQRMDRLDAFYEKIINTFNDYQVPLIKMEKSTPKEAVCQVFEKVNTGGVSLTVFELLTATFAADEFKLREDWEARTRRMGEYRVLRSLQSDDFVQAISLLASRKKRLAALAEGADDQRAPAITCKRKDLLKLTLSEYKEWADAVENAFIKAAKFLSSQHIFDARDLPYRTQLVPLAAVLVMLGNETESAGARERLAQWLWCGVFGELYGSATETRFARDVPELVAWIRGEDEPPTTVAEAYFTSDRLRTMKTRNSAAYKGVHALLMKMGAKDFKTAQEMNIATYFDESVDIHHIFPREYCAKSGIDASLADSVLNKSPLSARTNRQVGSKAPSEYLTQLQKSAELSPEQLDLVLRTHYIEPEYLRNDDFESFADARENALSEAIGEVMGKPVQMAN